MLLRPLDVPVKSIYIPVKKRKFGLNLIHKWLDMTTYMFFKQKSGSEVLTEFEWLGAFFVFKIIFWKLPFRLKNWIYQECILRFYEIFYGQAMWQFVPRQFKSDVLTVTKRSGCQNILKFTTLVIFGKNFAFLVVNNWF